MWFALFTVVLILAVTFFQGLQGLFTALITCVLTILASALAFGLYEQVYFTWLVDRQPEHGRAIALMAIFIVSLLVLRGLFDAIIKGNQTYPLYVDRVGGGLLGLITALVTIGTLATGLQMLPFGTSFLGFSRQVLVDKSTGTALVYSGEDKKDEIHFRAGLDWSKVEHRPRSLWLSPDKVAIGLAGHLSAGALHGGVNLLAMHPDLLGESYRARSAHYAASRDAVLARAITLEGFWDMPERSFYVREIVKEKTKNEGAQVKLKPLTDPPPAGMKRLVTRVRFDADARDTDNMHRFTTWQIRLLGRLRDNGPTREFFPVGASIEAAPRWVRLYPGEQIEREGSGPLSLDLVFEVPDATEFKPLLLEYKQNARAEFAPNLNKNEKPPGPPPAARKPKEGESGSPDDANNPDAPDTSSDTSQTGRPGQDRVSGLGPLQDGRFTDLMPFTLTDYSINEGEGAANGELRGGRLIARLNDDWTVPNGSEPAIERFQVPAGQVMLQLGVEKLQPQSWLGQLYGGLVDSISDFYLIDAAGKQYMPVGQMATARVSGQPTFEIIYLDDTARGMARLPKFQRIKSSHLVNDYSLVYLFHVPPGTRAAKLHTGRKDVDLAEFNLVAP